MHVYVYKNELVNHS